jgi:hypothetical protein
MVEQHNEPKTDEEDAKNKTKDLYINFSHQNKSNFVIFPMSRLIICWDFGECCLTYSQKNELPQFIDNEK